MNSKTATPKSNRWRRWLQHTAILCACGFAVVWIGRDLPRLAAEKVLSAAFDARVELGALEFASRDRLILHQLRLDRLRALPTIERIAIDQVTIGGWLGELRQRHLRSLVLGKVTVDIDASTPFELPSEGGGQSFEIDRIVVPDLRVNLQREERVSILRGEADLFEFGAHAHGRVELRSDLLDLVAARNLSSATAEWPVSGEAFQAAGEWRFSTAGAELSSEFSAVANALEIASDAGRATLPQTMISGEIVDVRTTVEISTSRLDLELDPLFEPRAEALQSHRLALVDPALQLTVEKLEQNVLYISADLAAANLRQAELRAQRHPEAPQWRDLSLRLSEADLALIPSPWPLDGRFDLELAGSETILDYQFDAHLASWPEILTPALQGPTQTRLQGNGVARFDEPGGTFAFTVELPATPQGRVVGGSWPPHLFPACLRLEGKFPWPLRAARGKIRFEPRRGGAIALHGALDWRDDLSAEGRWSWDGASLETVFTLLEPLGLSRPSFAMSGRVEATGEIFGRLTDPKLTATLDFAAVDLEPPTDSPEEQPLWRIEFWSGRVPLERRRNAAPWRWRVPKSNGLWIWREAPPLPFTLAVMGTLDNDLSRTAFDGLDLGLDVFGTIEGSGVWTLKPTSRLDAELRLEQASLPSWHHLLELANLGPSSSIDGTISGDGQLVFEPERGWSLSGEAQLTEGDYASADGARVIDGLGGSWQIELTQPDEGPLNFAARGKVGGFQLLWDTFYGDFSTVMSNLDLAGQSTPFEIAVQGALPEGPRFEVSLRAPDGFEQRYELGVELAVDDLGQTQERYLQPLLSAELEGVELSGKLTFDFEMGRDPQGLQSLAGRLAIEDLNLATPLPLRLSNLDLELPFELQRSIEEPSDKLYQGPMLDGLLRTDGLSLRQLQLPGIDSPLVINADSVALERALVLALLGGTVALESLTAQHLLSSERIFTSSLQWSGLRLDLLSERLGFIPLEGVLEGYLPRVGITANGQLKVTGGGETRIFGGQILMREISGRDLFSAYPKFSFSADFEKVDLAQLTHRFDFGEMSGLLSGTIEGAEFFREVPTAFLARFATVKHKGVEQRLDIKAIKNLTLLGNGEIASVFDRGLLQFFDSYRYAGFGVEARLVDDTLRIRGLEKRGDRELFLRGRLPLRIDIVNARPRVKVSFRSMVNRLRNLDFSGVTTER